MYLLPFLFYNSYLHKGFSAGTFCTFVYISVIHGSRGPFKSYSGCGVEGVQFSRKSVTKVYSSKLLALREDEWYQFPRKKHHLKCYYRPTASLQLNNKRNTKYNITVT